MSISNLFNRQRWQARCACPQVMSIRRRRQVPERKHGGAHLGQVDASLRHFANAYVSKSDCKKARAFWTHQGSLH